MNFVQLEQFLAFVTLDRRETSRTSMLLILSNLLSRFCVWRRCERYEIVPLLTSRRIVFVAVVQFLRKELTVSDLISC